MSRDDKDFPYKLFGKRLAWSQGFLPLINVPVRLPGTRPGKAGQDVTDADVAGFKINADGSTASFIADCRDTTSGAADRVLWVRGLAHYFQAAHIYLLKKRIPENAVWMANRLGIVAADEKSIGTMSRVLRLEELRGPYFDGSGYEGLAALYREPPKDSSYRSVLVFVASTVWSMTPAERVQSLLELLNTRELNKTFHPKDRLHQSLVIYGALQLALAVAQLTSVLGPTTLEHFETHLREALHGGAALLQQKLRLAKALNDRTGDSLDVKAFPLLVEVAHRVVIKRYALNDAVRYLDVLRHYHAAGHPTPASLSYMRSPVARKFARDFLGLFIRANNLDQGFLELAESMNGDVQEKEPDDPHVTGDEPQHGLQTMLPLGLTRS